MARKPRQDFSVSKVRFFSLFWLSVGHSKKGKWALLLHSNRDMWQSLNKIIEKEKTLLFKTKKLFSLFTQPPHFFFRQLSLSLTLPFSSPSSSIEAPNKAPTFGHHFCSKSRKEGIFGVVKRVSTCGTSKFQVWVDFFLS